MRVIVDGTAGGPLDPLDRGLQYGDGRFETVAWRDGIVRGLEKAGALVLDARPSDVTPLLVKRYLEVKERRLL